MEQIRIFQKQDAIVQIKIVTIVHDIQFISFQEYNFKTRQLVFGDRI